MLMRTIKYAIALAGLSLLAFHVFATAVHNGPQHPLSKTIDPVTEAYIDPLLGQQWHLFAPDPATTAIAFQYHYRGQKQGWSDWIDPGEPLLRAHQRNLLSHIGHLYWIHTAMGTHLWNRDIALQAELRWKNVEANLDETALERLWTEQIVQTDEYRLASRYCTDLARQHAAAEGDEVLEVEFRVLQKHTRPFDNRRDTDAQPEPVVVGGYPGVQVSGTRRAD